MYKPRRRLGPSATRSARKAFADDIRVHVFFAATCVNCRTFWSDVIYLVEHADPALGEWDQTQRASTRNADRRARDDPR